MSSQKHIAARGEAPLEEQRLCIECGMCCDGTLFHFAHLIPGERGHLPEKIEENSHSDGKREYFALPCLYFMGKCTIYESKRAHVCSAYRCQLLKDLSEKRISGYSALKIVREAKKIREEVLLEYAKVTGQQEKVSFRQIQITLGRIWKNSLGTRGGETAISILQAKCNILEALLIKHIRSSEDYEKMVMK